MNNCLCLYFSCIAACRSHSYTLIEINHRPLLAASPPFIKSKLFTIKLNQSVSQHYSSSQPQIRTFDTINHCPRTSPLKHAFSRAISSAANLRETSKYVLPTIPWCCCWILLSSIHGHYGLPSAAAPEHQQEEQQQPPIKYATAV